MDKNKTAHTILTYALPSIPFDGWTNTALDRAAIKAGLKPGEYVRIFPAGVIDALDTWASHADNTLKEAATSLDLASMKIRERIAALVKLRLEYHLPHREALRSALSFYLMPWNSAHGLRCLYRTVDTIWHLAGDRSVDFNWYSKRVLLAGVYSSTTLYWLDDNSEGQAKSWDFLARRIENVMQLGKHLPFTKKRAD